MTTSHRSPKIRLGILLSGRGSNFGAIVSAIQAGQLQSAEIATVVSNRADAPGVAVAEAQGFDTAVFDSKTFSTREAFDQAVLDHLRFCEVELAVLAGYDRILTPVLLQAYPDRILNIHPSLLPAYGGAGMIGLKVHEAVIRAGETQSGCTVHLVTEQVDGGPILAQEAVPVLPTDTRQTLAGKVLALEHRLYPRIIDQVARSLLGDPARKPLVPGPLKVDSAPLASMLLSLVLALLFLGGCGKGFVYQRSVSELNQKAAELLEQGDAAAAVGRLESARDLMPDEPSILYNLGIAYQQNQQTDKAIVAFETFLKTFSGSDLQNKVLWSYAVVLEEKGDALLSEARKAREKHPQTEQDRQTVEENRLVALGVYKKAREAYQQVLRTGAAEPEAGGAPEQIENHLKQLTDQMAQVEAGKLEAGRLEGFSGGLSGQVGAGP